jgi:hypothetical protein
VVQQRALIGSALFGESGSAAAPLVFDRRGETHFEACAGLPRAPYVVAVASDNENPPLPPSLYIDRSDLDTDQMKLSVLTGRLHQVQIELQATQAILSESRTALSETQTGLSNERAALTRMRAELAQVLAEHSKAAADLQATTQRADLAEQARAELTQWTEILQRERDFGLQRLALVQGSLRTFIRGYLPRLARHLRGQQR